MQPENQLFLNKLQHSQQLKDWAHYFINICFNIFDTNEPKLQPVNFGKNIRKLSSLTS